MGNPDKGCVVLSKVDFPAFVESLARDHDIYGPVAKGSGHVFSAVRSADEMALDYVTTVTPPKKYILPPGEVLIEFRRKEGEWKAPDPRTRPFILFGVHSCDMQGILRLDWAFRRGQMEWNYFANREKAVIFGINCVPDEHCFCDAVHTQGRMDGFDLFLTDIGQSYCATAFSEKGRALLARVKTSAATPIDLKENERQLARCRHEVPGRFKPEVAELPLLCASGEGLDFWREDLEKRCFACGTCTLVCPTCYCFDVVDVVDLDLDSGRRIRHWDSCQLEEFAEVAGGESFREKRANRQKHRFYRKFRYLVGEYGAPFCVGCGRCGRQCVAKISIPEIATALKDGVDAL